MTDKNSMHANSYTTNMIENFVIISSNVISIGLNFKQSCKIK